MLQCILERHPEGVEVGMTNGSEERERWVSLDVKDE